MKNYRKKCGYVIIRWLILLLIICALLGVFTFRMREVVLIFAKSNAENILLKASDNAVLTAIEDCGFAYDDIVHTFRDDGGGVTDIQIDTVCINTLKNRISYNFNGMVKSDKYKVYIPVGTLFNNEFTTGFGPELTFNTGLAFTYRVNFKSAFCDAGINNVLHQIIITADISCSVLAFGATKSFSIKNEVIAAQAVIAGKVPESYTSVYETEPEKFADDIFNFGK